MCNCLLMGIILSWRRAYLVIKRYQQWRKAWFEIFIRSCVALWCRLWRSDVCLTRRARIQKCFTLVWNKLADVWTFDDISLFGLLQSAPHVEETQMGSKKGSEVKAVGLEKCYKFSIRTTEKPPLWTAMKIIRSMEACFFFFFFKSSFKKDQLPNWR